MFTRGKRPYCPQRFMSYKQDTQREFVATVHGMCMADILAFTYISIFMVEALAVDV